MQRTSVGQPLCSRNSILMFAQALTEGRAVMELAGEGLGWGERACAAPLQAHCPLELHSQLMFRDIPNVLMDERV